MVARQCALLATPRVSAGVGGQALRPHPALHCVTVAFPLASLGLSFLICKMAIPPSAHPSLRPQVAVNSKTA